MLQPIKRNRSGINFWETLTLSAGYFTTSQILSFKIRMQALTSSAERYMLMYLLASGTSIAMALSSPLKAATRIYLKVIAKTNKNKIKKILKKNKINLKKINKNNITLKKNNYNYNLNIWPLNEIILDKYFRLKLIYFKKLILQNFF